MIDDLLKHASKGQFVVARKGRAEADEGNSRAVLGLGVCVLPNIDPNVYIEV
jgi:hypothetical protein